MPGVRNQKSTASVVAYVLIFSILVCYSEPAFARRDPRVNKLPEQRVFGAKPRGRSRLPALGIPKSGGTSLVGGTSNDAGAGGSPQIGAADKAPVQEIPDENKGKNYIGEGGGGAGGGEEFRDEGPGVPKKYWLPLCFFMDSDYSQNTARATIKKVVDIYAACDVAVEAHATTLRKGTYSPDDPENLNANAVAHCTFKNYYKDNSLWGAGQSHPNSLIASDLMCAKSEKEKEDIRSGKKPPNTAGCAATPGDHSIVDWGAGGGTAAHEFGHNIGRPGKGGSYLENEGEGKEMSTPKPPEQPHQIFYTTVGGIGLQLKGFPEDPARIRQAPTGPHDEGAEANGGFTEPGCASIRGGANDNSVRKFLHHPGAFESYYTMETDATQQLDYNGRSKIFLDPDREKFGNSQIAARDHRGEGATTRSGSSDPINNESLKGSEHPPSMYQLAKEFTQSVLKGKKWTPPKPIPGQGEKPINKAPIPATENEPPNVGLANAVQPPKGSADTSSWWNSTLLSSGGAFGGGKSFDGSLAGGGESGGPGGSRSGGGGGREDAVAGRGRSEAGRSPASDSEGGGSSDFRFPKDRTEEGEPDGLVSGEKRKSAGRSERDLSSKSRSKTYNKENIGRGDTGNEVNGGDAGSSEGAEDSSDESAD